MVCEHNAQHRAHERDEKAVVAPERLVFVEIPVGIEDDERAHARHEKTPHEAQAVHHEGYFHVRRGDPGDGVGDGLPSAVRPFAVQVKERPQAHQRGRHGEPRGVFPETLCEPGNDEGGCEREENDDEGIIQFTDPSGWFSKIEIPKWAFYVRKIMA